MAAQIGIAESQVLPDLGRSQFRWNSLPFIGSLLVAAQLVENHSQILTRPAGLRISLQSGAVMPQRFVEVAQLLVTISDLEEGSRVASFFFSHFS